MILIFLWFSVVCDLILGVFFFMIWRFVLYIVVLIMWIIVLVLFVMVGFFLFVSCVWLGFKYL